MLNKTLYISLLICLLLSQSVKSQPKKELKGQIAISGAFALYPLVVRWADEFRKIHPKVKIDISAGGAGKGITDAVTSMVDIGMVSRDVNPEELTKGAYPIAVAKDAVVAIVNKSNPEIHNILTKGMTQSSFNSIWISGTAKTWGHVIIGAKKIQLHAYTRSDASGAAEVWAKYFGKKQEDLLGVAVFGDPGLTTAITKDALGIGYNNICYAYDVVTKKQFSGINVVPIDLNKNGKIDPDEDFYSSLDLLIKAISDGKYPSPPSRDLFFVTKGKVTKPVVKEFIKWILTDGQKFVGEAGFIILSKDLITSEIQKLN